MKDVEKLTGWSEGTVKKVFEQEDFPAIKIGKSNQVELEALRKYFSIKRVFR